MNCNTELVGGSLNFLENIDKRLENISLFKRSNLLIVIICLIIINITTFFIARHIYKSKCVDISKYDNKFKNQKF